MSIPPPPRPATWMARDGEKFGFQAWEPARAPLARVVAMHGLSCHAGDFAPLGERLANRGIALFAWHLRGQGLDPRLTRRGAWLEVDGMLADLADFVATLPEDGRPLFLAGDSMGALLAILAAARDPWRERLAGLLLIVPVVDLRQRNPPWLKPVLRVVSSLAPGLRLKPTWFVHGKGGAPPLSRIPERQRALEEAPHRLGPLTLGFLARMGDLIEHARTAAPRVQVPVAIFAAEEDVFVTLAQIRAFHAELASGDKALLPYAGAYHQLLFDLDAERVCADAVAWIEARLPSRKPPA